MSQIKVNQTKNTITVNGETRVVNVKTAGPQGPQGEGFDILLDHSDKVDNSVMYYNQSSGKLKLDSTTTKTTLVNGGNF
tara:strand:- start:1948 stop:2184 length:237 start_codon:yes stop_codon:yes gene_type:complete